jgi:cytokinesis protein
VSHHFPHLEVFLDELAKPSEANRVNFNDMQSTSKSMLEEIRNIRRSLQSNFTGDQDGYTRKMFRFAAVAEEELQDVRDGIVQAEKQLRDVQTYYCEGEEMARPMQSQDFFGIFRTFTSSYKVCNPVLPADISSAERPTGLVWRRRHLANGERKPELP